MTDAPNSHRAVSEFCIWNQDNEGGDIWESSCGNYFILNEGTPVENGMKFCFKCGKPLTESPYTEDADD